MHRPVRVTLAILFSSSLFALACDGEDNVAAEGREAPLERGEEDAHRAHMEEKFARLDTDGSGTLSRAEASEHWLGRGDKFDRIDTDGDGELTKDELRAMHERKRGRHEDMRHQHFAELDANSNGTLSQDEAKGPLAEHFNEIDADGDGELTKDELKAFHKEHGGPHGHPPGHVMEVLDENGNGTISKDEARGPMADDFAEIDADADGEVSGDEVHAFFEARHGDAHDGGGRGHRGKHN